MSAAKIARARTHGSAIVVLDDPSTMQARRAAQCWSLGGFLSSCGCWCARGPPGGWPLAPASLPGGRCATALDALSGCFARPAPGGPGPSAAFASFFGPAVTPFGGRCANALLSPPGYKFILLVEEGLQLPSNLQGLYECRYSGNELTASATMKLLKAFNEFKAAA